MGLGAHLFCLPGNHRLIQGVAFAAASSSRSEAIRGVCFLALMRGYRSWRSNVGPGARHGGNARSWAQNLVRDDILRETHLYRTDLPFGAARHGLWSGDADLRRPARRSLRGRARDRGQKPGCDTRRQAPAQQAFRRSGSCAISGESGSSRRSCSAVPTRPRHPVPISTSARRALPTPRSSTPRRHSSKMGLNPVIHVLFVDSKSEERGWPRQARP